MVVGKKTKCWEFWEERSLRFMEGLAPPEILAPTLIKQMAMCFDLCPWRFVFLPRGLQQIVELCKCLIQWFYL